MSVQYWLGYSISIILVVVVREELMIIIFCIYTEEVRNTHPQKVFVVIFQPGQSKTPLDGCIEIGQRQVLSVRCLLLWWLKNVPAPQFASSGLRHLKPRSDKAHSMPLFETLLEEFL